MAPLSSKLLAPIQTFLASLRYRTLFQVAATLLVVDLLIPDFIPFADELLLAIVTIVLSRLREPEEREPKMRNITPKQS